MARSKTKSNTFSPILAVGNIWEAESGETREINDLPFKRNVGMMVRYTRSLPHETTYRRATASERYFVKWINDTNAKLVSRDSQNEPPIGSPPVKEEEEE